MTREQTINVLETEKKCVLRDSYERSECASCDLVMPIEQILSAHDMAISAVQEQSKWIPVTERLTDNDDFVLVTASGKVGNITLDNALELAEFSVDDGWILEMWPEWEDPKVTYWMPLPEAPKENE